jgi:hypothetical protein
MLNTILDTETKIVTLQPHGALSEEDFDKAVKVIDPFIEEHGKLNGLIIYTKSFPGWEDFAAFNRHLRFIKNHHKEVKKLAFVTDSVVGDLGESISSHFVKADIKNFDLNQIIEAKDWILEA